MTTLNSTSILALIIAQNPLSNENQTYNPNINRIQNCNIRPMKKKSKNQVYIPHQDKWNEHFPTPGKPNPNYYTDSGATFNKHLRTQNKLKQKRK